MEGKYMKQNENNADELNIEIERRISEMEKPNYEFPQRFSKRDYIFAAAVAVICLAAIIVGGFIS